MCPSNHDQNQIKHCLLYSVQPAGVTLKNPPQVYPSLMDFAQAHAAKLRTPVGTQWSDGSAVPVPLQEEGSCVSV